MTVPVTHLAMPGRPGVAFCSGLWTMRATSRASAVTCPDCLKAGCARCAKTAFSPAGNSPMAGRLPKGGTRER